MASCSSPSRSCSRPMGARRRKFTAAADISSARHKTTTQLAGRVLSEPHAQFKGQPLVRATPMRLLLLLLSLMMAAFAVIEEQTTTTSRGFVRLAQASLAQQLPQVQPLPASMNKQQAANSAVTSQQSIKKADSTPTSQIQASSREIEKQIVDRILGDGYDKRIRPAGSGPYNTSKPGNDGPTIVKVNTLVRSISKIDDVTMEYSVQLTLRQEWTDERLAFSKMPQYKNYGLNSITLTEQERLWKPDLFFRNEKEGHFHKIIMPNVLLRIKGAGEVLYSIRISLVLACPMDLKYYPLDKQNCTIEMASYGYLDEDLKFIWKEVDPVQIAKPLNLPRFTLETYDTAYCTSRTTTGAYSCLRIDLIFKREFSYYLIQIYIPCCMLVIVSWVSFWLDPNAIPARVSLGVTTLLTMATQISGINASLPPVSYTKAIDVWTGVCLTFVFGALLEFALVNYASRSDQHKREMLTSALTQTQQMRWREATAAAAAAGVAPPTSPPPDENSPSMLMGKQPAFFGSFIPGLSSYSAPCAAHSLAAAAAIGASFGSHAATPAPHQLQPSPGLLLNHHQRPGPPPPPPPQPQPQLPTVAAATANSHQLNGDFKLPPPPLMMTSTANGRPASSLSGPTNQAPPAQGGTLGRNISADNGKGGAYTNSIGRLASSNSGATKTGNGPMQLTNRLAAAASQMGNLQHAGVDPNNCSGGGGGGKFGTQVNCSLQCMKSPREIHLMTQKNQKQKNWCKMWLAKFPTRSKRIDVISRIFFPLKFALFNLVYWTTYLFREEDTIT